MKQNFLLEIWMISKGLKTLLSKLRKDCYGVRKGKIRRRKFRNIKIIFVLKKIFQKSHVRTNFQISLRQRFKLGTSFKSYVRYNITEINIFTEI